MPPRHQLRNCAHMAIIVTEDETCISIGTKFSRNLHACFWQALHRVLDRLVQRRTALIQRDSRIPAAWLVVEGVRGGAGFLQEKTLKHYGPPMNADSRRFSGEAALPICQSILGPYAWRLYCCRKRRDLKYVDVIYLRILSVNQASKRFKCSKRS